MAFSRSALVAGLLLAGALALSPRAVAEEVHGASVRYDVGKAGYSVGAGYEHMSFFDDMLGWWGFGGGVALFASGKDVHAVGPTSNFRVVMGHAPPIAMELGIDAPISSARVQAVGHAGVYLSFLYADFGYAYQVPLGPFDRPEWLASHQFSARVHLPVSKWF